MENPATANPADVFFAAHGQDPTQVRRSVLLLRWLVIIATSYLVLFSGSLTRPALIGTVLVSFILSNVILHVVATERFLSNWLLTLVVLVDSSIISLALLLTPGIEGDIFILYFFVILLAAVGGSFWGIVIAAVVISGLYLMALGSTQGWERILRTDVLLRVPFIFCVCLFYGFLSEGARKERHRAETAELSERAKTQLFSTLTHDVKNDLGTIIGFSEILLDYSSEQLSPRSREILQQIQMTAMQSAQMISNLLDAARIEGGQLRIAPRPLRIGGLLGRVAERYGAQASLKHIALDVSVPEELPAIDGDELHLDRVFANLISNAVKFAPNGGRVAVRATANGPGVHVEITDDGPGIPSEDRDKVFQMYHQTDRGAKAGGTGLGLFVVRTVLEAHRARVEIADAQPKGTVFRVTFPRA